MTKFTVDIADPISLAGIAHAREQYNITLPPDDPAIFSTDADYFAFQAQQWAASWGRDARRVTVTKVAEAAIAGDDQAMGLIMQANAAKE